MFVVQALEKKYGFLDVQRIRKDAWPAIFIDATAGDQSITQRAFGESTFTCKGIGILAVNS